MVAGTQRSLAFGNIVSPNGCESGQAGAFEPSYKFLANNEEVIYRLGVFPRFKNPVLEETYIKQCTETIYSEFTFFLYPYISVIILGSLVQVVNPGIPFDDKIVYSFRAFLSLACLLCLFLWNKCVVNRTADGCAATAGQCASAESTAYRRKKIALIALFVVFCAQFVSAHFQAPNAIDPTVQMMTETVSSKLYVFPQYLVLFAAVIAMFFCVWCVKHDEVKSQLVILACAIFYCTFFAPFVELGVYQSISFCFYCALHSLGVLLSQREMRASFLRSVLLHRQLETIMQQKEVQLKMTLRQKRFFLKITHELRTPLNSILHCLDAARDDLAHVQGGAALNSVLQSLDTIQMGSQLILTLTNNLLDVARQDAKQDANNNIPNFLDTAPGGGGVGGVRRPSLPAPSCSFVYQPAGETARLNLNSTAFNATVFRQPLGHATLHRTAAPHAPPLPRVLRSDSVGMPICYGSVDVRECVARAVQINRPAARVKGLRLDMTVADTVPSDTMLGDATRIVQALNNTISNAIKFTSQGSVTVTVWAEQHASIPDAYRVCMCVKDTEKGIAADALPRLGSDFQQADESDAFVGSGLGLALTRQIAQSMGGDLTLTSEGLGCGATALIVLTLPLMHPPRPHRGSSGGEEHVVVEVTPPAVRVEPSESNAHHFVSPQQPPASPISPERHVPRPEASAAKSEGAEAALVVCVTTPDEDDCPAAPPPAMQTIRPSGTPVAGGEGPMGVLVSRGCRAVVIDDDFFNRQVLRALFLKAGFPAEVVTFAEDGVEAMGVLQAVLKDNTTDAPVFVITDLQMPVCNGADFGRRVARELKAGGAIRCHVPLFMVLCSAQSTEVILAEHPDCDPCLSEDIRIFDAVIEKPVGRGALSELADMFLKQMGR